MLSREEFLTLVGMRAAGQADRAVLMLAYLKRTGESDSKPMAYIGQMFEDAHLARPNSTHLLAKLTKDRRVSIRSKKGVALRAAQDFLGEVFPELMAPRIAVPALTSTMLAQTPFIDDRYLTTLDKQAELYKALHVLENSLRRLIQAVLVRSLGDEWWNIAAPSAMKRKHEDRLAKEQTRKWLPARSDMGPLYSIDWSDLVTLIRKYQDEFEPFIGEIDFMHRYADLGLVRHVIAHHGFIDDDAEFDRIALALRDWNRQVADAVREQFEL